jgi:hypothetical protein
MSKLNDIFFVAEKKKTKPKSSKGINNKHDYVDWHKRRHRDLVRCCDESSIRYSSHLNTSGDQTPKFDDLDLSDTDPANNNKDDECIVCMCQNDNEQDYEDIVEEPDTSTKSAKIKTLRKEINKMYKKILNDPFDLDSDKNADDDIDDFNLRLSDIDNTTGDLVGYVVPTAQSCWNKNDILMTCKKAKKCKKKY